ncbi:MAG: hypothetical protein BZY87_04590 [SAR202 cluster bacterium Io17-Chloro-G6]|nr:MAG: hypothetical protein BZY87_04590 [SAR202 cluster bacterium Io17-Chloro-G6]
MKITIGIIMLAIAGLMTLNVGLISAQESNSISGFVIDATTGFPIEGAEVQLESDLGQILSTVTNASGEYSVGEVPAGAQVVTASAEGYESESVGADISDDEGSTVDFTLQPLDEEEEEGDEAEELEADEGVREAGTRHGYVGIYNSTTASTTGAGVAAGFGEFTVTTKSGERIAIQLPGTGLASIAERTETFVSIIKTPGRPGRILADGDQVAVLVEFEEGHDGLVQVAVQVVVKPDKPAPHTVGAVVSITTDENGVRTVNIMRHNGKVKELQLGPDAELPEVGDLVTAFQGRGSGGNGPPVAKGLVRADAVRQRLESFLDDLTSEAGDLSPKALEKWARRVADIAALLEDHAADHLAVIEEVSSNSNLPPQAVAGMLKGLAKAENGIAKAIIKSNEAKIKVGKSNEGQSQGQGEGRGNR